MNWHLFGKKNKYDLEEFVNKLVKCQPEEIIGLATLMNIELKDGDSLPRKGEDLVVDICNNFVARPLMQRQRLIKILDKTTEFRTLPSFTEEQEKKQSEFEKWYEEHKKQVDAKKSLPEDVTDGTTTEDKNEIKD